VIGMNDENVAAKRLIYSFYKGWRYEADNDMLCLGESPQTQRLFLLTASSVSKDRKFRAHCVAMTMAQVVAAGSIVHDRVCVYSGELMIVVV
jgi:hypothetical protein